MYFKSIVKIKQFNCRCVLFYLDRRVSNLYQVLKTYDDQLSKFQIESNQILIVHDNRSFYLIKLHLKSFLALIEYISNLSNWKINQSSILQIHITISYNNLNSISYCSRDMNNKANLICSFREFKQAEIAYLPIIFFNELFKAYAFNSFKYSFPEVILHRSAVFIPDHTECKYLIFLLEMFGK